MALDPSQSLFVSAFRSPPSLLLLEAATGLSRQTDLSAAMMRS
jgi:hypothetical protein